MTATIEDALAATSACWKDKLGSDALAEASASWTDDELEPPKAFSQASAHKGSSAGGGESLGEASGVDDGVSAESPPELVGSP